MLFDVERARGDMCWGFYILWVRTWVRRQKKRWYRLRNVESTAEMSKEILSMYTSLSYMLVYLSKDNNVLVIYNENDLFSQKMYPLQTLK